MRIAVEYPKAGVDCALLRDRLRSFKGWGSQVAVVPGPNRVIFGIEGEDREEEEDEERFILGIVQKLVAECAM